MLLGLLSEPALPPDRGGSWPQHSSLTPQDCLWSGPTPTHLGSHLRWHCLAQAGITPETTVLNRKDKPVPGPSNISSHCLMYGNRYRVSCLGCRLDASWASFMAALGRALLLALGKQQHFVLMWIKNTIHFEMLPEVWGSYLQTAEQRSQQEYGIWLGKETFLS